MKTLFKSTSLLGLLLASTSIMGQVSPDSTKIDNLIKKNSDEEVALRNSINALTQARDREEIEKQVAIKMHKTLALERLNKLKEQYLEGSNVLIDMINSTEDLGTTVQYGQARSSFLDLVNPQNYTEYNNSIELIKGTLKDSQKAAFMTATTDLVSNLQKFVANPSSIVPGIMSAANKYSAKKEQMINAQYDLEKSISFISALYYDLEQLDKDDEDLNALLSNFKEKLIKYFPSYYYEFNKNNDLRYENLGDRVTSQKETNLLFRDRVIQYFNSLSTKIDSFNGGLESLKQLECGIFNEKEIRFVRKANKELLTYLSDFDSNIDKTVDRINVFQGLIKSYKRVGGLEYKKKEVITESINQVTAVLERFKKGAFRIQNSSRQTIEEVIQ